MATNNSQGLAEKWQGLNKSELLENIDKTDAKLLSEVERIEDERATLRVMRDMLSTLTKE